MKQVLIEGVDYYLDEKGLLTFMGSVDSAVDIAKESSDIIL